MATLQLASAGGAGGHEGEERQGRITRMRARSNHITRGVAAAGRGQPPLASPSFETLAGKLTSKARPIANSNPAPTSKTPIPIHAHPLPMHIQAVIGTYCTPNPAPTFLRTSRQSLHTMVTASRLPGVDSVAQVPSRPFTASSSR